MIRGIPIDLSGVIYIGEGPVADARDALSRIRESGLPVRFLTNTTRTPKRSLLERLSRMGFDIAAEDLFTPAQAARERLIERRLTPHLLIHPALEEDFRNLPFSTDGDRAVVVGDAGDGFTYKALNAAFRELAKGADFLALARNRTFLDADGELSLDTGAFIAALEYACGRTATVGASIALDARVGRSLGVRRRAEAYVARSHNADRAVLDSTRRDVRCSPRPLPSRIRLRVRVRPPRRRRRRRR